VQLATAEQDVPVDGGSSGQGLQCQKPLPWQSQILFPYEHPTPSGPTWPRQALPSAGIVAGHVQRRAPKASAQVQISSRLGNEQV
jgi:hypothetical protein